MLTLQQEGEITAHLQKKIDSVDGLVEQLLADGQAPYIIEETCMEALTRDLRPSKYNYIVFILEDEFETDYLRLKANGILIYEVSNLIGICLPLFDLFRFSEETVNDRNLSYAIISEVQDYLENI